MPSEQDSSQSVNLMLWELKENPRYSPLFAYPGARFIFVRVLEDSAWNSVSSTLRPESSPRELGRGSQTVNSTVSSC